MSPHLNEAAVQERITEARHRADHRRMVRTARLGFARRSNHRPILDALGHGLIALGARLVDSPPTADQPGLDRAA